MDITIFIDSERRRFKAEHNNMFAFAFVQVVRYRDFLKIIYDRHMPIAAELKANAEKIGEMNRAHSAISGILSDDEMRLLENDGLISTRLQCEIESFYLFAKILLDRVARAVEFYFGQGRNAGLDSHDDFVKNIGKYASQKNLEVNAELISVMASLKKNISDFRDYQIAHEKSPRTLRNSAIDAEGRAKMLLMQIYPKENEEQKESQSLEELFITINQYLGLIVDFLILNKDKTNLKVN